MAFRECGSLCENFQVGSVVCELTVGKVHVGIVGDLGAWLGCVVRVCGIVSVERGVASGSLLSYGRCVVRGECYGNGGWCGLEDWGVDVGVKVLEDIWVMVRSDGGVYLKLKEGVWVNASGEGGDGVDWYVIGEVFCVSWFTLICRLISPLKGGWKTRGRSRSQSRMRGRIQVRDEGILGEIIRSEAETKRRIPIRRRNGMRGRHAWA